MNIRNLYRAAVLAFCLTAAAAAQTFTWTTAGQGTLVDEGKSVCIDREGNSYVTGNFSSASFRIGKITLRNSSAMSTSMDMFVAKFDPNGTAVWAIQSNGAGEERGIDIACDQTGHISVVGVFRGEKATFGPTTLVNQFKFSNSTFIIRIAPSGEIKWVNRAGGKGDTSVAAVATGADGEIFVTGTFTGGTTFDGFAYQSRSGNNPTVFVARYQSDGRLKWFEQIFGTRPGGQRSSQEGKAIAVSPDSQFVYVAGWFRGLSTFADSQIASNTEPAPSGQRSNIFITKYDANGNGVWTRHIGQKQLNNSPDPEVTDIAADPNGGVYLTGYFSGVLLFGQSELRGNPSKGGWNHDVFVTRYDADGINQWYRSAGGANADRAHSIAGFRDGVLITGQLVGEDIRFGNIRLTNKNINLFAANYDSAGNCRWAADTRRLVLANGIGIAANETTAVITGSFLGRVIELFGETPIKGTGAGNFFVTGIK